MAMLERKRFSEELKRAVTDAKMSPADVASEAKAAGDRVNRATVYRWYEGKTLPRLATLDVVLKQCDLTLTDFFARVEQRLEPASAPVAATTPEAAALLRGLADPAVRTAMLDLLGQDIRQSLETLQRGGRAGAPAPASRGARTPTRKVKRRR